MTFTPDLERAARKMWNATALSDPGAKQFDELEPLLQQRFYKAYGVGLLELIDPVSEAVVEAMAPISDPVHWKDERWRKGIRERTRDALTAAIHAVVGKEADHD